MLLVPIVRYLTELHDGQFLAQIPAGHYTRRPLDLWHFTRKVSTQQADKLHFVYPNTILL